MERVWRSRQKCHRRELVPWCLNKYFAGWVLRLLWLHAKGPALFGQWTSGTRCWKAGKHRQGGNVGIALQMLPQGVGEHIVFSTGTFQKSISGYNLVEIVWRALNATNLIRIWKKWLRFRIQIKFACSSFPNLNIHLLNQGSSILLMFCFLYKMNVYIYKEHCQVQKLKKYDFETLRYVKIYCIRKGFHDMQGKVQISHGGLWGSWNHSREFQRFCCSAGQAELFLQGGFLERFSSLEVKDTYTFD